MKKAKKQRAPRDATTKIMGKRLAQLRKQKRLSQSELSRRTGIGQNLISEYEAGKVRMYGEVVARIARTLGVSTDEILALKNAESRPAIKPIARKIQRRAEMIEDLPLQEQTHVLRTIDLLVKGVGTEGPKKRVKRVSAK